MTKNRESDVKWENSTSITPSEIPNSALTKEFIIPSEKFATEKSVFQRLGNESKWNLDEVLDDFIGKGGFSRVYKIKRKRDSEEFACKVMDLIECFGTFQRDEQKFNGLKNEIFILTKMKHKNIISLIDHFIINHKSYINMELSNGGTLDQEIKKSWPLPELVLKQYFAQTVLALNYLHKKLIAHKDLKLANILISVDKKTQIKTLKLTDFGISRISFKNDQTIKVRRAEGTIAYMSPELLKLYLRNRVTKREKLGKIKETDSFISDIWALGVCLFIMVYNISPFKPSKDPEKLLNNMLNHQINRNFRQSTVKSESKQTISKELKDLIDSMLNQTLIKE
jgi:serine/threonine-protein kinase SRK2